MANALGEATAAYMRAYYRVHSTRVRRIAGAQRECKTCRRCGVAKLRSDFTIRQTGQRVGHLASYCKPCSADAVRGTYTVKHEADASRYRRVDWPAKLKRLYGITVADYHQMLADQGGGCALCRSTNPTAGNRAYKRTVRTAFDVDHCHATGKVRGLLCTRCNRLVGLANDNVETARNLVEYLSKGV